MPKEEPIKGEDKINSLLFSEFLGTFILAISIGFANVNDDESKVLRRMKAVMGVFIGIFLSKKISGPFLNPAVFIMILDLKKLALHKKYKFQFILSECLGGILGAILTYTLNMGKLKAVSISSDSQIISGCIGEFISTFFFFLLILAHIDPEFFTNKDIIVSSWVITAGLVCGSSLGSNLSNASMNPAIAFGNCFIGYINTGEFYRIKYVWIYILFPIFAALMVNKFYVDLMKFGDNPYTHENKGHPETCPTNALVNVGLTKESFRMEMMQFKSKSNLDSELIKNLTLSFNYKNVLNYLGKNTKNINKGIKVEKDENIGKKMSI